MISSRPISVIIVARNEEKSIARLLTRLNSMREVREIIVCDGQSDDQTCEIARQNGAIVLNCRANRGTQMNAGAEKARGEILWFLHADTIPAKSSTRKLAHAAQNAKIVGGNFRLRFDVQNRNHRKPKRSGKKRDDKNCDGENQSNKNCDENLELKKSGEIPNFQRNRERDDKRDFPEDRDLRKIRSFARTQNLRRERKKSAQRNSARKRNRQQIRGAHLVEDIARVLRIFGVYYGDSGIWIRRETFDEIGGFKNWPLFEDYDFVRRLEVFARKNGAKTVCIAAPLLVSSRRFDSGISRLLWRWLELQILFWRGVSPHELARRYHK